MRNGYVRVCAALLCAALLFSSGGSAFAQAATATISGLVVDQKGALPIAGATVSVRQDSNSVASSTTDASGRYTITGVAPGLYNISISANGYDISESNGVVVASGTTSVNARAVAVGDQRLVKDRHRPRKQLQRTQCGDDDFAIDQCG